MADDINQTIDQQAAAAKTATDWTADAAKGATDRVADATKSATDKAGDAARQASDALRQGADKARGAFNDHVVEPAKRAGEALKESGQRIAEGGSALGTKLIDQAEENTTQAFAAMRAAANAKDLSEVMSIQGSFLREQGQRSMAQAREIGELIMQFGRNAVSPLRGGEGSKG